MPNLTSPLVSIIIPCWNGENYVAKAIESALSQTYTQFEIVVIDDGSTDNSLDVIRSFGNDVRWQTGPNSGGGAARNKGLALARGEFVQFLDADDVLYPTRLESIVPVAQINGSMALPVSDWDVSPARSTADVARVTLPCLGSDSLVYCLEHPIQTSSPLHRRSHLNDIGGFNVALSCSQERDLHLRLMVRGLHLVKVDKSLYRVNRQERSVSSNYVKVLDQHKSIFLEVKRLLEEEGTLTPARSGAIARAFMYDARQYVRRGLSARAKEYIEIARVMHRDKGLSAFGRWYSRALARLVGPLHAEQIIHFFGGLRK